MLALAAVLEGREEYEIVDGNLEDHPVEAIAYDSSIAHQVELLGVSCDAWSADGRGHGSLARDQEAAAPRQDRVGRILPFDLSGCCAECESMWTLSCEDRERIRCWS